MNDTGSRLADRAATLRHAFDRSFAIPAQIDTTPMEDLLAVRMGSEACAIRLSEIAGLFADKKITRVPGHVAALLGIAGFRGAIVPVYDLHALLGHPTTKTPRWLVIASGAPIAFAFEAFDGHLRISRDTIVPREAGERARKYVTDVVRTDGVVRSLVRLSALLDVIETPKPESAPTQEP